MRSGILARKLPVALTRRDVTFNQDIKAIIPNRQAIYPDYLGWAVKSNETKALSEGVKQGATVQSISAGFLENLEIPLPPLPEQRRIAGELDRKMSALAEARAAVRVRVEAGEALPGVLLREAFEGIVPLAVGIPKTPAPSGWNWHRLTDLARLESGHTPSRKRPDWWGGDIPWLALPDIRALDGKIAMDTGEKTVHWGCGSSLLERNR